VKKQHNIDARATDNKVTSGNKSDNSFSCQDDHFSQIFPAVYQSSLKNIANDPFLPSKQISNISVMAASSDSIRMRLEKKMKFVFVSSSSNHTTTNDREQLFQHLQRVHLDTTLCKDIAAMCPAFKSSDINLFYKCSLRI